MYTNTVYHSIRRKIIIKFENSTCVARIRGQLLFPVMTLTQTTNFNGNKDMRCNMSQLFYQSKSILDLETRVHKTKSTPQL
jgi:hypothetical protein